MNPLQHLNNVLTSRAAFVPVCLASTIRQAAALQGITLCAGYLDPDSGRIVLYVA